MLSIPILLTKDLYKNLDLQIGEVHTWLFNPKDTVSFDGLALLSAEERQRAERFKFEIDRLRFIRRRGILRELLGRYLSVNPASLRYQTNPFGKLSLPGNPISFNLSASQDYITLVFSRQSEVGVDIEVVRELPDLLSLINRVFSEQEQEALAKISTENQLDAFFHVWTQKEAYLKARGLGFSIEPRDFSVSVDPNGAGKLLEVTGEDAGNWELGCFLPEPGMRLAVCVQRK